MITTAVKPAPLEMPMIPGSARGFFSTAWNSTPDTAMAAPASIEIKIRGKRRSKTVAAFSLTSPSMPRSISERLTFRLPMLREAKKRARSSRAMIPKDMAARTFFFLLLLLSCSSRESSGFSCICFVSSISFSFTLPLHPRRSPGKAWAAVPPGLPDSGRWRSCRRVHRTDNKSGLPARLQNVSRCHWFQNLPQTSP